MAKNFFWVSVVTDHLEVSYHLAALLMVDHGSYMGTGATLFCYDYSVILLNGKVTYLLDVMASLEGWANIGDE